MGAVGLLRHVEMPGECHNPPNRDIANDSM